MAVNNRTIATLYNSVITDLESEMVVTIHVFGKVFLRALAAVQAGKLKLYYLVLAFVQKNLLPDTAQSESVGGTLERFGRLYLGGNPFAAVAGVYTCAVTGTAGSTIKAGTTFKSNDDSASPGYLYVIDADYVLTGTNDTINLRALTTGVEAALEVTNQLTSTQPIALVDSIAEVTAIDTESKAAETIENYRKRTNDAIQIEAQGGAMGDYRIWSGDAQGVLRVYPYAKSGEQGSVNLYVEATIADSIDGKGTPSATLLSEVENVVEIDPDISKPVNTRYRRPTQTIVYFLPTSPKNIDIYIPGSNYTPLQQSAIRGSIESLIGEMRPFVGGAQQLSSKKDLLEGNQITGAILNAAPGTTFGAVTFEVDSIPSSTYTFVEGNIPYLNSVNFV